MDFFYFEEIKFSDIIIYMLYLNGYFDELKYNRVLISGLLDVTDCCCMGSHTVRKKKINN